MLQMPISSKLSDRIQKKRKIPLKLFANIRILEIKNLLKILSLFFRGKRSIKKVLKLKNFEE